MSWLRMGPKLAMIRFFFLARDLDLSVRNSVFQRAVSIRTFYSETNSFRQSHSSLIMVHNRVPWLYDLIKLSAGVDMLH